MKINIFGSTGHIGKLCLNLIESSFNNIKVNLLCADQNLSLLIKQINKYKPRYVYLNNEDKSKELMLKVKGKTKVLTFDELNNYLYNSNSNLSLLAVSGIKSLNYLEPIIKNTENLGLVSKEAVVSAGHLFKKLKIYKKTNIFPIDSEHFSLYSYFNTNTKNNINRIILTASGGPFLGKKFKSLRNISFSEAIKHPKWKMGYKNSIDSATLVNKCLEVVEAHYLFDIPFKNIDILIHPQSIVHSIVENRNYYSNMIMFKNDMKIPLYNFLLLSNKKNVDYKNSMYFKNYENFNFNQVNSTEFPIYNYFKKLDKNLPMNIINFNILNEMSVDLFRRKLIKYTDIYRIIKKVTSLNLYSSVNTIKDIIHYHEEIEHKLQDFKI